MEVHKSRLWQPEWYGQQLEEIAQGGVVVFSEEDQIWPFTNPLVHVTRVFDWRAGAIVDYSRMYSQLAHEAHYSAPSTRSSQAMTTAAERLHALCARVRRAATAGVAAVPPPTGDVVTSEAAVGATAVAHTPPLVGAATPASAEAGAQPRPWAGRLRAQLARGAQQQATAGAGEAAAAGTATAAAVAAAAARAASASVSSGAQANGAATAGVAAGGAAAPLPILQGGEAGVTPERHAVEYLISYFRSIIQGGQPNPMPSHSLADHVRQYSGKFPTLCSRIEVQPVCMEWDEHLVRESEVFHPLGAYLRVLLGHDVRGKMVWESMHRLVAWAFHGPPPLVGGHVAVACHTCHNRRCLSPWHIRWGCKLVNSLTMFNVAMLAQQQPGKHNDFVTDCMLGYECRKELLLSAFVTDRVEQLKRSASQLDVLRAAKDSLSALYKVSSYTTYLSDLDHCMGLLSTFSIWPAPHHNLHPLT